MFELIVFSICSKDGSHLFSKVVLMVLTLIPEFSAQSLYAGHAGSITIISSPGLRSVDIAVKIENTINSNTKMIVLNYPNNPTGKILPEKLQDDIVDLARKNNLYVLSDEIYSQYAKSSWKSILSYNYEKSIVTQSFSKSHAMTGFRIGYGIADTKIIEKMAKLEALCLTNVSEPIQYVAMKALEADTSNNTNTVQNRLDVLVEKAKKMGLDFVVPDGAMYLFARVNQDGFDGVQFANSTLEKGLAIAPGEGFGDYKNFIRISACQDEKILIDGMIILNHIISDKQ